MCDWDEEEDQKCYEEFANLNINSNNSTQPKFNQSSNSGSWNSSSDNNRFDNDSRGRGRGRGGRGRGRGNFRDDNNDTGSFGGSDNQGGFSSWNNDNENGSSRFDSNRSSGGCHNCGETGHMKRDCPNPRKQFGSSGGGSRGCHNCGEEGHMVRDCPNPRKQFGSSGGGGSRGCHNCGEEGHMARECPNPRKQFGSSGGGGNSSNGFNKGCHNCGEEGHIRRDCTNPPKEGAGGSQEGKPGPQTYVPVELDENSLFDQGVTAGSNFSSFDTVSVQVSGSGDIPGKIENFSDSSLRPLLLENVEKAGYDRPLPVQKHAIPVILGGRDLMACAQTGSGKTAAFLLPILNYIMENNLDSNSYGDQIKPCGLILSPTRELAIQIFNEARKFSFQSIVKVCVVYGGTSVSHQERTLQRGCHILVATPGRLVDFLEKGLISFECLKYFVLDEADRMLDMGFKTSIEKVAQHSSFPDRLDRRTLMFSATFPEDIQQLAKRYLGDYVFIVTGMIGAANVDVRQSILSIPASEKKDKLLTFIKEQLELNDKEKILVFVETKRMADFIALFLSNSEVNTTSIHGDRFQSQREEALREFKMGIRNVLVATAVAARGLDIKGVGIVLNYDMPKEIDEYVHRIGRTGRVGNSGRAVSFFDQTNDAAIAKNLVKLLGDAQQRVPEWLIECAHYSGGVMSFQGINKFGASDIRNQVKREEFASAPSYAGGPVNSAPMSNIPDDKQSWD